MSSKVEAALEQEIAEVRARIDATPDGKLLARLGQMLDLYRGVSPVADAIRRPMAGTVTIFEPITVPPGVTVGRSPTPRVRSPERQAAVDEAAKLMSGRNFLTSTREVLDHLNKLGIQVPGKSPFNNLSAMLSNDPRFVNHDRKGWMLAANENPVDAVIPAGSASTGLIEDRSDPVEPRAQGGEARPGGGT